MTAPVTDLRSALELLGGIPGQLVRYPEPVDPYCGLAAVFRQASRGAAVLFERMKGFEMPVAAGVFATRERAALLLGWPMDRLPFNLMEAAARPVAAVGSQAAPCQQVLLRPPFDLRRLLPAVTHTPDDAGPFITAGLVRAEDPETGLANVSIHRMCLQGADTLSIYFVPGRHTGLLRAKAEAAGRALPISVSIGLDPALYLAACAAAPEGADELAIAGGIRGRAVELVDCISVRAKAVACAEIVLEGEILPGVRVREDAIGGTGFSMPEFHGYMGAAERDVPVLRVAAVTHRRNPVYQTIISPGGERANLIGIPTEARILQAAERALPGVVRNAYMHPAGGGSNLAILQVAARAGAGNRGREAAQIALAACRELKQVMLVDEDVNLFDSDDVLWAMVTRSQGERDIEFHRGPALRFLGDVARTVLDCRVPFDRQAKFKRPRFGARLGHRLESD
jgi:gallate decarboxylase subunit C